jgi:hypothetical protein
MIGQPVPAWQVRRGDLLSYQGRELLVTGTYGTWYHQDGQPVAGLAIECRSGSAWWILYRRGTDELDRVRTGPGMTRDGSREHQVTGRIGTPATPAGKE